MEQQIHTLISHQCSCESKKQYSDIFDEGTVLLKLKKYKQADDKLSEAIQMNPKNAMYLTVFGNLKQQMGEMQQSQRLYRLVLKLERCNFAANWYLAQLLCKTGKYQQSLFYYQKAIQQKQDNSTCRYYYSKALSTIGKKKEAIRQAKLATKLSPLIFSNQSYLALLLFQEQLYEEAELHFKKALKINQKHFATHINYANLLAHLHRYEESQQQYQVGLQINPHNMIAMYNYGVLLQKTQKLVEAQRIFKDLVEKKPNENKYRKNLADCMLYQKKYAQAGQEYSKCDPHNPHIVVNWALTKFHLNDNEAIDKLLEARSTINSVQNVSKKEIQILNKKLDSIQVIQQLKTFTSQMTQTQISQLKQSSNFIFQSLHDRQSKEKTMEEFQQQLQMFKIQILEKYARLQTNQQLLNGEQAKIVTRVGQLQKDILVLKKEFQWNSKFDQIISEFQRSGNKKVAKYGRNVCWVLCSSVQAYRHVGLGLIQGGQIATSKIGGFIAKINKLLKLGSRLPMVGHLCGLIAQIGNFYLHHDKKAIVKKIMSSTDELWSEKLITQAAAQTSILLLSSSKILNLISCPVKGKWYERIGRKIQNKTKKFILKVEELKFESEMDLAIEHCAQIILQLAMEKHDKQIQTEVNPLKRMCEIMIENL